MYEGGEIAASAGQREHSAQSFEERTGAGMMVGQVKSDPTLQNPRCVLNVLRRHFARYTPEMVERVCGIPPALFHQVADALIKNSGRERTGALCYAVGWTQHTAGVQMIRSGAILMLAIFLGIEVISKVPTMLHTPLMSGTNAIHGIVIVGAILVAGRADADTLTLVVGFVAVVLGSANVVGGSSSPTGCSRCSSSVDRRSRANEPEDRPSSSTWSRS